MPRDEQTVPRHVRDALIIELAKRRWSSRRIGKEVGLSHVAVNDIINKWRNPDYRRTSKQVYDPSDEDFYA